MAADFETTSYWLFGREAAQFIGLIITLVGAGVAWGRHRKEMEQAEEKHKALKTDVKELEDEVKELRDRQADQAIVVGVLKGSMETLVSTAERLEKKLDQLLLDRGKGDK